MTRSRASAKAAGASFERKEADYLGAAVDDRIDRRAKTGGQDRGDLGGIRLSPALGGGRVVAELKDCSPRLPAGAAGKGRCGSCLALGTWMAEAEVERLNDGAEVALVIHKRHGVAAAGQQWVTLTVDDLAALLTGQRPDPEAVAATLAALAAHRADRRAQIAEAVQ